jgi:hypothetical protein
VAQLNRLDEKETEMSSEATINHPSNDFEREEKVLQRGLFCLKRMLYFEFQMEIVRTRIAVFHEYLFPLIPIQHLHQDINKIHLGGL